MARSLTLGKLSEYDDLLTDHLIDKVFFWTRTHKADKHKTHSSRSVKTSDIVDIIQRHVIAHGSKLKDAVQAFLGLSTVECFYRGLTSAQKSDFERHLRKYLCIYHPQAGFEICSTTRYPGPKAESCVTAIRPWRAGEVIKYLAGTIVAMTEEEEDFYEAGHDFSILYSSRLDSMCLFLGPARFVNHDCKPNGAFVTQGGSIAITLIRSVGLGEEITVYYSADYFGPNNMDCLCATCESNQAGGYRSDAEKIAQAQVSLEEEDQISLAAFRARSVKGKRNCLQTIEVATGTMPKAIGIHTPSQMATPSSELSVDVAKETINLSDDDSFHSAGEEPDYGDEDYEDGPFHDTIDSQVDSAAESCLTSRMGQKRARKPSDDIDRVGPVRKTLRPRGITHDYNLKTQSLASVRPRRAENVQRKSRRLHNADMDYCSVCDEDVPHAVVEEIWTRLEQVGVKDLLCKRCERHAKLYGDPWPVRTPKAKASKYNGSDHTRELSRGHARSPRSAGTRDREHPVNRRRSSESPRKRSRLSYPEEGPHTRGEDDPISTIELAKARMKRGSILVPHLTASLLAARQKAGSGDRIDLPTKKNGEICTVPGSISAKIKTEPKTNSQAMADTLLMCFCCKDRGERCSRADNGHRPCQRCLTFDRICVNEFDLPEAIENTKSSSCQDQVEAAGKSRNSDHSKERTLSPDSEVAAYQVKSPKKISNFLITHKHDQDEVYDFDRANFASSRDKTLPPAASKEGSDMTESAVVSKSEPRKPRARRSGTWFYVEASDSEDFTPVLTQGRTRGQERKAVLGPQITKPRKIYKDPDTSDEDDSDVSVVSYCAPTTVPKKTRRPRQQNWEYISIESDQEVKPPVIVEGLRSARRKSALSNKA